MSEVKVNKISPRTNCGTVQLGDSGDTITIPAGVSITNSGTASGFGATGETSWVTTVKTATFTATAGEGYFCNTTAGAFTVNLPAGVAGASVAVADYAGTFQTNNLTISPNGSEKIGGVNSDVVLNTEGQSATFVYIDSTQGWINVIDSTSNIRGNPYIIATGGTITTSGNCKIHTFTGPGTFTVCSVAACSADNVMSHVVIAGGAGGGSNGGGGGGAGGYREVVSPSSPYTGSPLNGYPSAPNRVTVTATPFPITVGAGGAGVPGAENRGANGSPSIFSTVTSAGGGGGGSSSPPVRAGGPGGSGGGARSNISQPGGTGNTPPTSPAQGTNGGATGAGPICVGGGGGGAGGPGCSGDPGPGGGGIGTTSSINGTPTIRAGGGGGASNNGSNPGGPAGPGGGGAGGINTDQGTAGTVNTGGGGGGSGGGAPVTIGAAGGSGIVIIRYKFQ